MLSATVRTPVHECSCLYMPLAPRADTATAPPDSVKACLEKRRDLHRVSSMARTRHVTPYGSCTIAAPTLTCPAPVVACCLLPTMSIRRISPRKNTTPSSTELTLYD